MSQWGAASATIVMLALLALYPLPMMSELGLLLTTLILSFFIYWHLAAVMLLRRRAYIGTIARPQSSWRLRLWRSTLAQVVAAFAAIVLAGWVLIAAAQLSPVEWLMLALSVVTFYLFYWSLNGWVRRHIQPEYRSLVRIRLSHWCNLVVLTLTFLALNYWFLDVADTRALGWGEVLQEAFMQQWEQAELKLAGLMLGINAAIHAGFWHLTQVMSIWLPWYLTLLVWLSVMLAVMLQIGLIWLPLLGAIGLFSKKRKQPPPTSDSQQHSLAQQFIVWVLVAVPVIIALTGLQRIELREASQPVQVETEHQTLGPCDSFYLAQTQMTLNRATPVIRTEQQREAVALAEDVIAALVMQAFAQKDKVIDAFLDWNFSLAGQYTQLGLLAQAQFSESSFEVLLQEQFSRFSQQYLAADMSAVETQLNAEMMAILRHQGKGFVQRLDELVPLDQQGCLAMEGMRIPLDSMLNKSAVGSGMVPGLVLMSRALGPSSVLVARAGGRRAVAMLSGRMTARAGASAAAASAGSVCGPVCMLVMGGVTWVGTDLVINYTDEQRNRAAMYRELQQGFDEHQAAIEQALRDDFAIWAAVFFTQLEQQQQLRFNLSRELGQH